jgi:hypothetical protein
MELAYSGSTQAYRPFTNFGGIGSQTDGANSIYRCGMAKIEKRFSYGKSIASRTGSMTMARNLDRARSGFDRRH